MTEIMDPRLRKLLKQVVAERWKKQGIYDLVSVTDIRWMVALRRADERKGTDWLVKLLRSDNPMPRGFEMSLMARDVLAELLEGWRVGKRHGRMTTLFAVTAPDRYEEAAKMVRDMRSGGTAIFDKESTIKLLPRDLRLRVEHLDVEDVEKDDALFLEVAEALHVVQKTMSLTDRVNAVARIRHLDPNTLAQHISNKVGWWGRGKKPSGKKRSRGKKSVATK